MTRTAHHAWDQFVRPGDTVVDATCGNGYDTIHLARLVGHEGHVFAFDVQRDAVHSARYVVTTGLQEEQLPKLTFLQACHSALQEHVQTPVKLVCFNLGYFPGGDKGLVTKPETTVAAIQAAMALLQEGGLVSILLYTGHEGGKEECEAVLQLLSGLRAHEWTVSLHELVNRPSAPKLVLVYKPIKTV